MSGNAAARRKLAMKIKLLTIITVLCITRIALGGDIYTGNCDGTNTDVKNKLTCYNCCNDQNGTANETANCQNSCDGVWKRMVSDGPSSFLPEAFIDDLFASRDDWKAQMSFFTDDDLWEWFTADDEVNIHVVEMVLWLYLNAADVVITKHAIVLLSSLHFDGKLSPDGKKLAEDIFMDALGSEDFRVRRAALYSFQDTDVYLTNPAILVEMIRVTAQDPDKSVRDVGFQILADY